MKLIKEYAWDDITTLEHEDFFPEINEWAYNNNLVVRGLACVSCRNKVYRSHK